MGENVEKEEKGASLLLPLLVMFVLCLRFTVLADAGSPDMQQNEAQAAAAAAAHMILGAGWGGGGGGSCLLSSQISVNSY